MNELLIPITRPLQIVDRCDSCTAQALIRVSNIYEDAVYDLLFCGHHFNKHEPMLAANGWEILEDIRND